MPRHPKHYHFNIRRERLSTAAMSAADAFDRLQMAARDHAAATTPEGIKKTKDELAYRARAFVAWEDALWRVKLRDDKLKKAKSDG